MSTCLYTTRISQTLNLRQGNFNATPCTFILSAVDPDPKKINTPTPLYAPIELERNTLQSSAGEVPLSSNTIFLACCLSTHN